MFGPAALPGSTAVAGPVDVRAAALAAPPLQVSPRLLLQGYELVGAALGLFIAYLAYRGYRRNDSRPMLFVAVGFALILAVPLPLTVGYLLLAVDRPVAFQALIQTLEIAGLLCIVYALRMES